MGIVKRTHKKFDYKPRYYKGEGNPYEIKHKFDHFRTTTGNKNLKDKFTNAFEELRSSESKGTNKTILITIAILVFIFLYIIDFDLSIFQQK